MNKLPFATWIANAAAYLQRRHGDVTQHALQQHCSRQTVYQHAHKVQAALQQQHVQQPPHAAARSPIYEQLQEENRQLRQALHQAQTLDARQQEHWAAACAALGLSLNQSRDLLAVLVPPAQLPSRAVLGRLRQHAQQQATRVLQKLDAAFAPKVESLAVDEVFCRATPILMGVEPASLTWVVGQRAEDRSGQTWAAALAPWTKLGYVLADAATGLHKGLKLFQQRRRAAWERREARSRAPTGARPNDVSADASSASQPPARDVPTREPPASETSPPALEVNLDPFHILRGAPTLLARQWRKVDRLWEEAEQKDRVVAQRKQQGIDARYANGKAQGAWNQVAQAAAEAERWEPAVARLRQAFALFLPHGELNTREHAAQEIQASLAVLRGAAWKKVRNLAQHPQALTFLDRLPRRLAEAEPNAALREACVRLYWLRREAPGRGAEGSVLGAEVVQRVYLARLSEAWRASYARVAAVLGGFYRGSGSVECLNSVVRMHQSRHRHLPQGLVDLKRLHWNTSALRSGIRRGRCPYELLGVPLGGVRWWDLLQMTEAELDGWLASLAIAESPESPEELSTSKLAA